MCSDLCLARRRRPVNASFGLADRRHRLTWQRVRRRSRQRIESLVREVGIAQRNRQIVVSQRQTTVSTWTCGLMRRDGVRSSCGKSFRPRRSGKTLAGRVRQILVGPTVRLRTTGSRFRLAGQRRLRVPGRIERSRRGDRERSRRGAGCQRVGIRRLRVNRVATKRNRGE